MNNTTCTIADAIKEYSIILEKIKVKVRLIIKLYGTPAQCKQTAATVEPLLSGHPRGNGKWLLKRGWLLNRVQQKLA